MRKLQINKGRGQKNKNKTKVVAFTLLGAAFVIMLAGCGKSVETDTADTTEVTETETTEETVSADTDESTGTACWIMETEKEKALALQEYVENSLLELAEVDNVSGGIDGETEEISTTSSSSSSGSSSSSSGSGSSTGNTSTSNSSGSSSNSSGSSSSTCSHDWRITSSNTDEGYYTYYCNSCSLGSGHTGTRYICNHCGAVFETYDAIDNHFKERQAYAQANYDTAKEIAMNSCGSFTIDPAYQIDNIAWCSGTAKKTLVTTSVNTYTCSKCGETKTETVTNETAAGTIEFAIDPYNGEDVDAWLNSHYN